MIFLLTSIAYLVILLLPMFARSWTSWFFLSLIAWLPSFTPWLYELLFISEGEAFPADDDIYDILFGVLLFSSIPAFLGSLGRAVSLFAESKGQERPSSWLIDILVVILASIVLWFAFIFLMGKSFSGN